ncbi:MAG TPA: hypothetical protein VJB97_03925, partial [Candidatus Paceibacterota bacterium]
MFNPSGGNVGIGTTSPRSILDITGSGGSNSGTTGGTLVVTGASADPSSAFGSITIESNTAQAINVGPTFSFGGRMSDSSTATNLLGAIQAAKANGTSGNGDAYMRFTVRQDGTGVSEKMRILANGNVGIGDTNPTAAKLVTTSSTDAAVIQYVSNTGSAVTGTMMQLIAPNMAGDSTAYRYMQMDATGGDSNFIFRGDGNAYADIAFNGGGADYAEYVTPKPGTTPAQYPKGSLICLVTSDPDTYGFCDGANDKDVVGIISTNPALIGNSPAIGDAEGPQREEAHIILAMLGRVPLRVSLEGGPIAIGDRLTASSQPGYAMKATSTARTVGFALEDYSSQTADQKVMAYIQPELTLGQQERTALANLVQEGSSTVFDTVHATSTVTDELCIAGDCRSAWPTVATSTDLSGYATLSLLNSATSTLWSAVDSNTAALGSLPNFASFASVSTLDSATSSLSDSFNFALAQQTSAASASLDVATSSLAASFASQLASAISSISTSTPDLSG